MGKIGAAITLGVAITAKATIGFPLIWHKTFGPWNLWSDSWQLWSGCTALWSRQLDEVPRELLGTRDIVLSRKGAATCSSACLQVTGLQYCTQMNGASLCNMSPADALAEEAGVQSYIQTVLGTQGADCAAQMLDYYCALALPVCDGSGNVQPVAFSECTNMLETCGATSSEASQECTGVSASPFSMLQIKAGNGGLHPIRHGIESCQYPTTEMSACKVSQDLEVAVDPRLWHTAGDADAVVLGIVEKLRAAGVSESCMNSATAMTCAGYLPECRNERPTPMCKSACVQLLQACDTTATHAEATCAAIGATSTDCGYSTVVAAATPSTTEGASLLLILVYVAAGVVGLGLIALAVAMLRRRRSLAGREAEMVGRNKV